MSDHEETQHVENAPPVDVETAEEHAATEQPHSPAHEASHEAKQHEDGDGNHLDHHRKASLASLHSLKDRDQPADHDHADSSPTSPKSVSDAASFRSPEMNDVALEDLSLDDPKPLKLETASLDPPHASGSQAVPEDSPLKTAKPKDDEDERMEDNVEADNVEADKVEVDKVEVDKVEVDKVEVDKAEVDLTEGHATSPQSAAKSPQTTLDSLLSPTKDEFKFPVRDSVAASDTTDDDTRFSTVLLSSARTSVDPAHASLGTPLSARLHETLTELPEEGHDGEPERDDRRDTLDGNEIVRLIHQNRVHKKTASTSTIVSGNNVPFILARVEGEDAKRSSLDGKQKLQEEFEKKHESVDSRAEANVDWDFWGDVVSDYQAYAQAYPRQLAKAIEKGIPKSLRGMIWQLMSASKDPELEQTYVRLLKESSPHEKAISRDLGRTFPHHAFFTDGHGIGQENLFNVLKAYSLYDAEVGYCQGLPFVVAILLLNMPDEEAFCLLVRLMHSYDLRGHFLPEMPKLQQRMFQFDRLLEEVLPVLHIHFIRQGIKSSMYCSQWFLTMFSYKFPLDIVFRIYDNVLASGIEALFSFSLCLLYKNEETLLNMKFDQLLVFLNTKMLDVYQVGEVEGDNGTKVPIYDIDQYVQDAVSMNITPFMLDQYANEYEELVRTRDAQLIEMDALRNSNRALSAQVKNLETNLAQLNAEHVKILNELVMARLRHEELESELVRYKLLYAEAMHQSEDALSSHRMSRMSIFSRRSSGNTGS